MFTHICCRFDAYNCLDYLLKHFFLENAVRFIDYVNAPTSEGDTPLHLCGVWRAEKCFNVLYFYGGLHLSAFNRNNKTPYNTAY
jgi:hypothetical protein